MHGVCEKLMEEKMLDSKPEPLLLTLEEASQQLGGLSRTKLFELMREGQLKPVKIGRRTFLTLDVLRRFVSDQAQASELSDE